MKFQSWLAVGSDYICYCEDNVGKINISNKKLLTGRNYMKDYLCVDNKFYHVKPTISYLKPQVNLNSFLLFAFERTMG